MFTPRSWVQILAALAVGVALTSCRSKRIRDLDGVYAYDPVATTNANVRSGVMSAEDARSITSRDNWMVLRGRWMARSAEGALIGGAEEIRVEKMEAPFYRVTTTWLDAESVYTVEAVNDGLWVSAGNDPRRAKYSQLTNATAISAEADQLISDAGLTGRIKGLFGIVEPYQVPKGSGHVRIDDEGETATD